MWGEDSAPQRARAPAEGVPRADSDSPLVVTAAVDLARLSATLALPVRGAPPDCLTLDALGIAVRHCSLPGGTEQTYLRVQRHCPSPPCPRTARQRGPPRRRGASGQARGSTRSGAAEGRGVSD